ncbi:MAG TPA: TadE family protein [Streptosporangiaceae bacterium]|jgi:Flp pilus assembly protein TadG
MSVARALRRRLRDQPDRGSSVVELAVLTPALMMLCMLILQFGLWFNARQVALASAQAGATVAREEANSRPGSWAGDAQAAAQNYYESLHTGLLTKVMPRAHGSPLTNVYVTVQGPLAYTVFPFFKINLTITETAGGPVECFRPAGQNGC